MLEGKWAKCIYYHKDFACKNKTVKTSTLHKHLSLECKSNIVDEKQTILMFIKSKIDGDGCEGASTTLLLIRGWGIPRVL